MTDIMKSVVELDSLSSSVFWKALKDFMNLFKEKICSVCCSANSFDRLIMHLHLLLTAAKFILFESNDFGYFIRNIVSIGGGWAGKSTYDCAQKKNLHVHFLLKALKLRCWRKYHGFHLFPFLFFSLIVWHETRCHIKRYNDSNFFFLTKEKRNSRIRCRIFNSSSKQC